MSVERVFTSVLSSWLKPRCSMVFCSWCTNFITIIGASHSITAAQEWKYTDAAAISA